MAEVGVVLLLFSIGLEFSIERLQRLLRMLLVGGGLQVLLTIGGGGRDLRHRRVPDPPGRLPRLPRRALEHRGRAPRAHRAAAGRRPARAGDRRRAHLPGPLRRPDDAAAPAARGGGRLGRADRPRAREGGGPGRRHRAPRALAGAAGARAGRALGATRALPPRGAARLRGDRLAHLARRALARARRVPRGPGARGQRLRAPGARRGDPLPRGAHQPVLRLGRDALRPRRALAAAARGAPLGGGGRRRQGGGRGRGDARAPDAAAGGGARGRWGSRRSASSRSCSPRPGGTRTCSTPSR